MFYRGALPVEPVRGQIGHPWGPLDDHLQGQRGGGLIRCSFEAEYTIGPGGVPYLVYTAELLHPLRAASPFVI